MRHNSWISGLAVGLAFGFYLGFSTLGPFYLDGSTLHVSHRTSHDILQQFLAIEEGALELSNGKMNDAEIDRSTMSTISSQKVVVWTTDYFTGGPEALFQLVLALHRRGHTVYRTSDLAPELHAYYPDWVDVPFVPFPDIDRIVHPGDVIIIPEEQSCPNLERFPFGVRKAKWILAGASHKPQPPCNLLHHSFELARANGSPMSTVLMPYIHRDRSGFVHHDLAETKRNVICVAAHNVPHLAEELRNSTFLNQHIQDLEVRLIKGLTPPQVVELLRQCKVLIDGSLPGLERLPLEATTFGAIPIFDPTTGIPENVLDLPLPSDYLGPWSDETHGVTNATRLERTVARALLEYPQEAQKFNPLRNRIAGMEAQFEETVDKTFREAAAFIIPCDATNDGELCLLAAINVLLVSPLSLVHVFLHGDGDDGRSREGYLQQHAGIVAASHAMHMKGLIAVLDEDGCMEEIFNSAPNYRVIVLAADAMLARNGGGSETTTILGVKTSGDVRAAPSSGDIKSPVHWSWARLRDLVQQHSMYEIDVNGSWRERKHRGSSFHVHSVRPLLEGTLILDQRHLVPFIIMCSDPLWRKAIRHSPRWERVCKAMSEKE